MFKKEINGENYFNKYDNSQRPFIYVFKNIKEKYL